jgi:hypothetical protein
MPAEFDRGKTEGEPRACRTLRGIGGAIIGAVLLAEEPELLVGRGDRPGDVGGNACFQAGLDLLAVVVADIRTTSKPWLRTSLAWSAIGLSQSRSPGSLVTSLAIMSLCLLSTAICALEPTSMPRPFPSFIARLSGAVSESWVVPLSSSWACQSVEKRLRCWSASIFTCQWSATAPPGVPASSWWS